MKAFIVSQLVKYFIGLLDGRVTAKYLLDLIEEADLFYVTAAEKRSYVYDILKVFLQDDRPSYILNLLVELGVYLSRK